MFRSRFLAFITIYVVWIVLLQVMSSSACPQHIGNENEQHWGMPGGFSAPHAPTQEELSLLKRAWLETVNKCSHLPKEIEHVKVCSVRKQVVAGMNYEYTLSDSTGRTFKTVIYVPIGQDNNNEQVLRVNMCESQGPQEFGVES